MCICFTQKTTLLYSKSNIIKCGSIQKTKKCRIICRKRLVGCLPCVWRQENKKIYSNFIVFVPISVIFVCTTGNNRHRYCFPLYFCFDSRVSCRCGVIQIMKMLHTHCCFIASSFWFFGLFSFLSFLVFLLYGKQKRRQWWEDDDYCSGKTTRCSRCALIGKIGWWDE